MDKELIEAVGTAIYNALAVTRGYGVQETSDALSQAALDAHNAHLESKGLVVVPREPSIPQIKVMWQMQLDHEIRHPEDRNRMKEAYCAMIQAALEDGE